MEQEILNALRNDFPDVQGEVSLEPTTERFNGHILSDGFKGLSFVERQSRVFNILRKSLGSKAKQISFIFTYTPFEYEQIDSA